MRAIALTEGIAPWRAITAALCANLVGVGLGRFAYTPLIPALIAAHWYSASSAVYLGAANLAGYLAGALLAPQMAARVGAGPTLRIMMVAATTAFFACAFPLSFWWYSVWRVGSGVAGGVLMALAAPLVLPQISQSRRGLASGVIFTGVGLGIAASGTLVPVLMRAGLAQTWFGLGGVALMLTIASWTGWPHDEFPRPSPPGAQTERHHSAALRALYIEYGLNAIGLVPHMIFLVDFVARGLGQGLGVGASYWVLFGIGALIGPLAAGRLADGIGAAAAMRLAFFAQIVCVALLAVTTIPLSLTISCLIIGAMVPGIVSLTLGRVHELIPHDTDGQRMAWGLCTTAFALGQAVAAYAFSYIFARTGGEYQMLYGIAAAALAAALVIDVLAGRPSTRRRRAMSE